MEHILGRRKNSNYMLHFVVAYTWWSKAIFISVDVRFTKFSCFFHFLVFFFYSRELKQDITYLTITSPSLHHHFLCMFVYLRFVARLVILSTEFTKHTLNYWIVGQAWPQSVNKQTNKGSDGEVMVRWWWSDGEVMVNEVMSCFNSLLDFQLYLVLK